MTLNSTMGILLKPLINLKLLLAIVSQSSHKTPSCQLPTRIKELNSDLEEEGKIVFKASSLEEIRSIPGMSQELLQKLILTKT